MNDHELVLLLRSIDHRLLFLDVAVGCMAILFLVMFAFGMLFIIKATNDAMKAEGRQGKD